MNIKRRCVIILLGIQNLNKSKMIGEVQYLDDDWTSVIDDLDELQLSENLTKLIPPSRLHRGEDLKAAAGGAFVEEVKGKEEYSLVI